MARYRAILLEPTIGRAVSKSWRRYLVSGLEKLDLPMQYGGRKGVGIEPLHLLRQRQSKSKVTGNWICGYQICILQCLQANASQIQWNNGIRRQRLQRTATA